MKDVILNRLRTPTLMPFDVVFLSKKYIQNLPNIILYDKMLEDLSFLTNQSHHGGNLTNTRTLCEYLKKATIVEKQTVEEYFSRIMTMRDILSL